MGTITLALGAVKKNATNDQGLCVLVVRGEYPPPAPSRVGRGLGEGLSLRTTSTHPPCTNDATIGGLSVHLATAMFDPMIIW
jgi:hypothetical protein